MLVLAGVGVVLAAVLGGYLIHHGNPAVLWQPSEFVIIGGAAAGSLLISAPRPTLVKLVRELGKVCRPPGGTKESYRELLVTLYQLFRLAARQGALGLEPHVERPEESDILSANRELMADRPLLEFFCDTLKLVLAGGVSEHLLAELTEMSLERHREEGRRPHELLNRLADSLPGLGIVAAVLGIIITMQSIDGSAAEVGHKVAAALVGTLLGVLLAYGFVGPLSARLEALAHDSHQRMACVRECLLGYARGLHPSVCVELGRRALPDHARPGFAELEAACREEARLEEAA